MESKLIQIVEVVNAQRVGTRARVKLAQTAKVVFVEQGNVIQLRLLEVQQACRPIVHPKGLRLDLQTDPLLHPRTSRVFTRAKIIFKTFWRQILIVVAPIAIHVMTDSTVRGILTV